jgi:hypothetical protein
VKLNASADKERPFTYDHDGRCTFAKGLPVRFSDTWSSSKDHDPQVEVDLRKKTVVIHDEYADGDSVAQWKITLRLQETQ